MKYFTHLFSMRLSFILLFLGKSVLIFAQDKASIRPENIHIASPTASSLGKVADIPVGYHTGIPNVDIPLYTVHEGSLQVPISLNYHASGLKVMEQASWVGAGFSLNAGGMITRTVRGNADEVFSSASENPTSYLYNKGYYNYLYQPDNQQLDYVAFGKGEKDGEPDLFIFNFNGYSGKFYFRADNSVVLVPQQDIRVTPLFCEGCDLGSDYLKGWIVTTPDGVNYYFGKTSSTTDVDPIEKVQPYANLGGQSFVKTISSWFLYRMESPDKKFSINFNYVAEEYSYYTLSTYPVESTASIGNLSGMDVVRNFIYGVRLSSITTSNSTVTFVPTSTPRLDLSSTQGALVDIDPVPAPEGTIDKNAKALASIVISNASGTSLCQSFNFDYDYFYDDSEMKWVVFGANIHSDQRRLKLLSVTEKSCNSQLSKPPYIFTYFDEELVPRTLSLAQDHWGYYNGAESNTTLIPPLSTDGGGTFTSGADRQSVWPKMRAGTLQKIQYPTGGFTSFEFENHYGFSLQPGGTSYSLLGEVNADANNTSTTEIDFTVTGVTPFKVNIFLTSGSGGAVPGQGVIWIVNTQTQQTQGFSIAGDHFFSLDNGNYKCYATSSSNSSGAAIIGKLYKGYNSDQLTQVPVGGLRIARITKSSGLALDDQVVQKFTYPWKGSDVGVLFSHPTYISLARNDRNATSGIAHSLDENNNLIAQPSLGCITLGSPSPYAFYYSPGSIIPMRTTQGNHIGYNTVYVMEADGSYTVYNYSHYENSLTEVSNRVIDTNVCDSDAPNYPPAPERVDLMRGELVNTSYHNSKGVLLAEKRITPVYTYERVGVNGLIVKSYNLGGGNIYYLSTEYELISGYKSKTTEVNITYDVKTGSPYSVKTETFFNSPNHKFPAKNILYDNNGAAIRENRQTYVADIIVPSCGGNYSTTDDESLVTSISSAGLTYATARSLCSNATCLFNAWQNYMIAINENRKAYVNSRVTANSQYNSCMTNASLLNAATPDLKALINLKNRNQISSVIETSSWRYGRFLGSEFVTYKDFAGDNAIIYPGKYETIKLSTPSDSFYSLTNTNTTLTKDTRYETEESYSYDNGTLTETLSRNGITTSYLWGFNNTLVIAKAEGVPYSVLRNAYITAGSDVSALRNQPSMARVNLTTFNYDPLIGMTSMTDPNNVTTRYAYDPLGRLVNIKDNTGKIIKTFGYHYKR